MREPLSSRRKVVWQQALEIVQEEESTRAAWLHGIVHTLEGDLDDARY